MKKFMCALLIGLSLAVPVFAGGFLSANDLAADKLATSKTFDGFTVKATADKGVTIETVDEVREAEDGEIFNVRIKLNGSGKADYRSVQFDGKQGETLTVYLNSGSKTDARVLIVAKADGSVVSNLTAPPDSGVAGIASCKLPTTGTYVMYSKSSGINLYQIIVE
ncbi:MAG: hypothetical protein SPD11_11305 [Sphaerochaetaceae bacterium]|nr:hypothetical protein [Sphaerochaetaceae bacterium]